MSKPIVYSTLKMKKISLFCFAMQSYNRILPLSSKMLFNIRWSKMELGWSKCLAKLTKL